MLETSVLKLYRGQFAFDKVRKIMEKETNLKEMVRLSPEVIVYLL